VTFRPFLCPLCVFLVACACARAATAPEQPAPPDDDLRLPGIFQSLLPFTEGKYALKMTLRPSFGDLTKRDYLRAPIGLRYGLSERWEISGEAQTYFSHGLKDRSFFEDSGVAGMRFTSKYHLARPLFGRWDTATGIEYLRPLNNPPPQITDGLQHVVPFVTFARPIEGYPGARFFWSLAADLINPTHIRGEMVRNELNDDTLTFATGVVWQRFPFTYTFETSISTTQAFGDIDEELITVRPGVVWRVPQKYTFDSKAEWFLGLGLRGEHGPEGTDFGVSARVKVSFDFKRWLRERREARR
jgi:hypothetical protein